MLECNHAFLPRWCDTGDEKHSFDYRSEAKRSKVLAHSLLDTHSIQRRSPFYFSFYVLDVHDCCVCAGGCSGGVDIALVGV
jgi:hypothetical protein